MEFASLNVVKTNDEKKWFMTVEDVASGYGVTRNCIMNHLREHSDEFRPELEKGVSDTDTPGGSQTKTILYREGVIKLGFFVRSEQAKEFRKWATAIVCDYMDKKNASINDMFTYLKVELMTSIEASQEETRAGYEKLSNICQGFRDEIDELKATLNIFITDTDAAEIRTLINRVKKHNETDGRAIVGHVRKTLNISSIYGTPDVRKVKNVLQNMLGEGLILQPTQRTEVK